MPQKGARFNRLERAKHTLNFLESLKIGRAILVGHSEGGFIATRIAIQAPKLVGKLVIVTSGSTAPRLGGKRDKEWIRAAKEAYNWELEASSEENYIKNFKQNMLFNLQALSDHTLRTNYRQAKQSGNIQLYLNLPPEETDPNIYYSMQEKYLFPYLSQMKVSTLLVWASDDSTVPVGRGLRLMEIIPNADMYIFDKAKHMVMIDRSEEFNRLLISFCDS